MAAAGGEGERRDGSGRRTGGDNWGGGHACKSPLMLVSFFSPGEKEGKVTEGQKQEFEYVAWEAN